jgi:hypothetical protein
MEKRFWGTNMEQNLETYLNERKCKGFVARPHYFPDGDYVTFYLSDERSYAERVDGLLTVYRSMKTDELVGCKIKGVRRLLEDGGNFGVSVKDEGVRLSFLFLIGLSLPEDKDEQERRRMYTECAKATQNVFLEKREVGNLQVV